MQLQHSPDKTIKSKIHPFSSYRYPTHRQWQILNFWNSKDPEIILYPTWSFSFLLPHPTDLQVQPILYLKHLDSFLGSLSPKLFFLFRSCIISHLAQCNSHSPGFPPQISILSNFLSLPPPESFSSPSTKALESLALHTKTLCSQPKTYKVRHGKLFSHFLSSPLISG